MPPESADVLILGAGLAGLRAALSCLEASPGLRVLVASATGSPSGSSFANQNDALGIHVCRSDAEREAYVREALALNRGAHLSLELLAVQAQEGEDRLKDLLDLGLNFRRDDTGALLGHSSCFSPHSRRAFVFTGLASAFACFKARLDALGCLFAPGWLAASIVTRRGAEAIIPPEPAASTSCPDAPQHAATMAHGRAHRDGQSLRKQPERRDRQQSTEACGAFLVPREGGEPVFVSARVVIAALGGPGRLFAHSMAGPGTPGYGHGLLLNAGTAMDNLGFLQFMWGTVPGRTFWQPAALGAGGYRVVLPDGRETSMEDILSLSPDTAHPADASRRRSLGSLQELCASRAEHCPFGYGLEDSALDLALASGRDDSGIVRLIQPDGAPLLVAPMAHASNGGAIIDEHGQTSIPGLLACGECATGMHGANRIGGGMVLATQVFGHRAGLHAALLAHNSGDPDICHAARETFMREFAQDPAQRAEGLEWLATGLSRFAVPGSRSGRESFTQHLRQRLDTARDWRLRLSLLTALHVVQNVSRSLP
ncbi:MAG: FAD-binding protein [Acidobacteriota bacterium]